MPSYGCVVMYMHALVFDIYAIFDAIGLFFLFVFFDVLCVPGGDKLRGEVCYTMYTHILYK